MSSLRECMGCGFEKLLLIVFRITEGTGGAYHL